jgi:hypothetical protein
MMFWCAAFCSCPRCTSSRVRAVGLIAWLQWPTTTTARKSGNRSPRMLEDVMPLTLSVAINPTNSASKKPGGLDGPQIP